MINARALIPSHDVLFVTLDTLRFDVAQDAWRQGLTPNFAQVLPSTGWEKRHTPGSFTYAAHHAFFAGFLPTPAVPGVHGRLFAARFAGSETTDGNTYVFESADIVTGFADLGYHTICIGGVGFFNKQTALGCVLPNLFAQSFWSPQLGVTDPCSTENQVNKALQMLESVPRQQRIFMFVNVSAMHQPNCFYVPGATVDSKETQTAALCYADTQLPRLWEAMRRRAPLLSIVCSDHGTAYGEDGFVGHRLAHDVVWTVPYAEWIMPEVRA
jgi:hypothetical protein